MYTLVEYMTKIALMSSWNACCGVSIHAELIGKAWLKQGQDLTVFAPRFYEDRRTYLYFSPDEEFVIRNYSFLRYGDRYEDKGLLDSFYFDPKPVLETDFDLFVVEKPTSIPLGRLLEVFPKIKKKAQTVAILHEGILPTNPYFSKLDWDAIAVFDKRYKQLFSKVFPAEKIHIIPFPCHPVERGNKIEARKKLGLPEEAKTVFTFGRFYGIEGILQMLRELSEGYPHLVYLCMVRNLERFTLLKRLKQIYRFVRVELARPPTEKLYEYLKASDTLLLNRTHPKHVAVSSTAHLCLGSLRPILCSDVGYFHTFDREVIKYKSLAELETRIMDVFEGRTAETLESARKYVIQHSADKIAKKLLEIAL